MNIWLALAAFIISGKALFQLNQLPLITRQVVAGGFYLPTEGSYSINAARNGTEVLCVKIFNSIFNCI